MHVAERITNIYNNVLNRVPIPYDNRRQKKIDGFIDKSEIEREIQK